MVHGNVKVISVFNLKLLKELKLIQVNQQNRYDYEKKNDFKNLKYLFLGINIRNNSNR
jgi:hypothetical protein